LAAIPNSALRVLLVLMRHADAQGQAWPSLNTIQHLAGIRKRSTLWALTWLQANGFIKRTRRKTPTGADQSSVYELQPPLLGECNKETTGGSRIAQGWFPHCTGGVQWGNHEQEPIEQESMNKIMYCSEPSKKASEPNHDEAAVLTFQCVGTGPSQWTLTASKLQQYREAFPGIDVLAECRKARQWLIDNPPRRKTAKGMPRFLNSWLSRAQDRAGRNGQPAPKPKAKTTNLPYLN